MAMPVFFGLLPHKITSPVLSNLFRNKPLVLCNKILRLLLPPAFQNYRKADTRFPVSFQKGKSPDTVFSNLPILNQQLK